MVLTFKLSISTACSTLLTGCNSNSVAITQRNKYKHETLSSKTQQFTLIEKKLINEEKIQQGNKKEKLTES